MTAASPDPVTESLPIPVAADFGADPAAIAQAHRRYWRFNLLVIAVLCLIGGAVSFVLPMFASTLAQVSFMGWSLPYYMGAQGAILVYVMLICIYVLLMQRADRVLQRVLHGRPSKAAGRRSREPRA